jgi:RNA polymerase sigma-70 factor (ECF subfamily)
MVETTWGILRGLLIDQYDDLRIRLTRRFGSEELARESLHETWLRLNRQDSCGNVQRPGAYLMQIAVNIATDQLRADRRRAKRAEIEAALEIADPTPDPAEQTAMRMEFQNTQRAILELPERTRRILICSRLEGMTHQAIAEQFGISRRTVLYELKRAMDYLDRHLDHDRHQPACASDTPESS